jgi:hypothetical protein
MTEQRSRHYSLKHSKGTAFSVRRGQSEVGGAWRLSEKLS